MSRFVSLSVFAVLCALPIPARCNNTFFLPGDAFFYTRLTQYEVSLIAATPSPVVTYGAPRDGGYFCGYAGYQKLKIDKMSAKTRIALSKAFRLLKPQLKPDKDGVPRVSVFICNRLFDWRKHRLAIQYNEHWVDQTAAFGHGKSHMRLEDFVTTSKALMTAWRDSPRVKPLRATSPELPSGFKGAWSKSPVVINGGAQFLVVPSRDFNAYFEMKNGLSLVQVTTEGAVKYVIKNRKWTKP